MGHEIPTASPRSPQSPEEEAVDSPFQGVDHDREKIPSWKWTGNIVVLCLTSLIHGYDVSNIANIQPHLYAAFGNIELLPWVALSYTLSVFAMTSMSRKVTYCFDLRWIYTVCIAVFMAGAAIGGSASSISVVIVARVIMGMGGAIIYQTNLTFVSVFAKPNETHRLIGGLSACWAAGLIVGGPIGAALAENPHTTWRWAFYMNLPWMGLTLLLTLLCFPSKYLGPNVPMLRRLLQIDPIGIGFNMATPILFSLTLLFSGSVWAWGSAPSIIVWVVFGVLLIAWVIQQYFCIFTTPEQRAVPVHILSRLDLLPLWIASGCAGVSYAVTLYYVPLFFAFVRGHDAIQQTVRSLPFILVFIFVVIGVAALLPVLGRRYYLLYIFAGIAMVAGGGAMAGTLSPYVSESRVMGLEVLIGIGLGCSFQHGVGISNVINKDSRDRVDSAVVLAMAQMGAISISLSMAGSIFQNVGSRLLAEAVGGRGYSEEDIRQALAGVSSVVWSSDDPEVLRRAVEAIATVLAREFFLVVAAGALCVVCGLWMGLGRREYQEKKPEVPKV